MMASILNSASVAADQRLSDAHDLKLRRAGVAGGFYPADPAALTVMMDAMLSRVPASSIDGEILAVVAPHAGYLYSGPVAAYTYAALKGRSYARVVVIAPSHHEAFSFTSVYEGDGYVTPLGTVPVDKQFANELTKMGRSIQLSERGHEAARQEAEHAIEVQLPWLQHVLGSFSLIPIVMGDQSYKSCRALGVALARLIQSSGTHQHLNQGSGDTLIVASSDLSHHHTYKEAEEIDHKTLNAIESWDYLSMSRNFAAGSWEACGGAPIVASMIAAERMGANQAHVLNYANSGDVTSEYQHVVGYSADVFVKAAGEKAMDAPFALSEEEKRELLVLAHEAVEHAVRDRTLFHSTATGDAVLDQDRGAFVTLLEAGKLRGCVGYSAAAQPLYKTVRDTATLAAMRDPRFRPVTAGELPELQYEISVLSPLVHVDDVSRIEIGKHGLVIKNGNHEGILLPQVAAEQRWDRTRFLEETCIKAGLSPDCWKDDDTDIFCFTALVFGDLELPTAN